MRAQISQPLVPLVDEFAARLFGELDYEAEGRNAERFSRLYGHVPVSRLRGLLRGCVNCALCVCRGGWAMDF